MAECLEEQSFDRCEAAPQFFVNYALDISVEVHMDDLHGTGPKPALDLVRVNFSHDDSFQGSDGVRHRHEVRTPQA